jgi:Autophagy protein ATG9
VRCCTRAALHAGMLNQGVLDLHVPLPGLRSKPLLTNTVTWLLRFCMLDVMFDDNFELQQPFLRSGVVLSARFRAAAAASAVLSPFILLFLLMHFVLKHLERIYHHPSSLGALSKAAACTARPHRLSSRSVHRQACTARPHRQACTARPHRQACTARPHRQAAPPGRTARRRAVH